MSILTEFLTAAGAFVATNLDDIVLLTLFFSLMQHKSQKKYIGLGEYFGIATLVILSFFGARGLAAVLGRYIWLIGALPLFLGIKAAADLFRPDDSAEEETGLLAGTWLLVYKEWAVTVANGADNLSIYIPLLAERSTQSSLVFFLFMMVMTTFWWLLAGGIVSFPGIGERIRRLSRYLVPAAFIFVGISTILKGILF